ncbi:MAG: hypothetical protein QF464_13660, partial [Myxococcota bacterium]|nr:hypothetical protein [Myxococcota bacterium]
MSEVTANVGPSRPGVVLVLVLSMGCGVGCTDIIPIEGAAPAVPDAGYTTLRVEVRESDSPHSVDSLSGGVMWPTHTADVTTGPEPTVDAEPSEDLPSCQPDCAGKVCGDDGCDGDCGVCGVGLVCLDGACELANQVCPGGWKCDPDDVEVQACEVCGTRERTCTDLCHWTAWGSCVVDTVCLPGELVSEHQYTACGECGQQAQVRTRTCVDGCQWGAWSAWSLEGSCVEQGLCTPGEYDDEIQEVPCDGCTSKQQRRDRICLDGCQWSDWEPWVDITMCTGQAICSPGDV